MPEPTFTLLRRSELAGRGIVRLGGFRATAADRRAAQEESA
ncbi:hypothetical protein [Streptomyces sp. SID9727]|nr:hypothetical protein [Streptomyces sp. SID9727]